jgi:AbrB family looped-hinge helix DNA binding protein
LLVETLTISPKYQVVIPKKIREAPHPSPGRKVRAVAYENRIELIPVRPIQQMKGFLKGSDTEVPREGDRV